MTPRRAAVRRLIGTCVCAAAVVVSLIAAETRQAGAPPASPPPPAPWTDPLGRSTPRGAARGFLDAARGGDNARAALYLNTDRPDEAEVARKLFVVLDSRLPARLVKISDERDGTDPATPDREVAGTIQGNTGPADVVFERVQRKSEPGPIWLISQPTITAALRQYDEIASSRWSGVVPGFLIRTRVGGLRLVDVLAILIGLPLLYLATVFLNRALTPLIGLGFRAAGSQRQSVLPASARLRLVVICLPGVSTRTEIEPPIDVAATDPA